MFERFPTKFSDAILLKLSAYVDERGFFEESYVRSKYCEIGIADQFVQDNLSFSKRRVLRGLHSDPQMSKLVYVLSGEVFDVIVDARKGSLTFGQWEGVYLRAQERTQLYIPAGFLHGFLALTEDVIFCYKQSAEYAPKREVGVIWNDPDLAIEWPLNGEPIVSAKDSQNRRFRDAIRGGP